MNPHLSYFIDGLFGTYHFRSGVSNVLYKELPSLAYPFGIAISIVIVFWLFKHSIEKGMTLYQPEQPTVPSLVKTMWKRNQKARINLVTVILITFFVIIIKLVDIGDAIRIYVQYRQQTTQNIEGTVVVLNIQKGLGRSSRASIDLAFIDHSGEIRHLYLVNGNKHLANQIEDHNRHSYRATLYLDKTGKEMMISDFINE